MSAPQQPPRRCAPGLLRLLPDSLPLYTYNYEWNNILGRLRHLTARKRHKVDEEKNAQQNSINANVDEAEGDRSMRFRQGEVIPNAPLLHITSIENPNRTNEGLTLFFFVDSTNRQSMLAIPLVSQWFNYALNEDGSGTTNGNQVICVPNHPSPHEINIRNSSSDAIAQANINSSSVTSAAKPQIISMLQDTGFYHLPFLHPKRLALLHLLGATRVPCVIVVSNDNGRIVTRYGWEAIEREISSLEQWIERDWIKNKKGDGDEDGSAYKDEGCKPHFESQVVEEWRKGNSGLPMWWHLLSWILY